MMLWMTSFLMPTLLVPILFEVANGALVHKTPNPALNWTCAVFCAGPVSFTLGIFGKVACSDRVGGGICRTLHSLLRLAH